MAQKLLSKRAIVLAVISLVLLFLTVASLIGFFSLNVNSSVFYSFVGLDFVMLAYVGRHVWKKVFVSSSKNIETPLQKKITILFSLLSLIPASIVIVLAIIIFNYGMQDWFQSFVQTSIEESLVVAKSYLEEHKSLVGKDARLMAQDIVSNWTKFPRGDEGKEVREEYLNALCAMRSFSELLIFNSDQDVVGKASLTFALEFEPIPAWALEKATSNEVVVLTSSNHDRVRALVGVEVEGMKLFLFVGRPIDKNVLVHLESVDKSAEEYRLLSQKRVGLQVVFVVLFIMGSGVLLVFAVWLGMVYAEKLTRPMRFLTQYAERLAAGKTHLRLEVPNKDDELYSLNNSLKRMFNTIEKQRQDVLNAQYELEEYNVFISRTLQGVSSGVLRIDRSGSILYHNCRAEEMLRAAHITVDLQKSSLAQALPTLLPLLSPDNFLEKSTMLDSEVVLGRRNFRVCVVAETHGETIQGYIITLDDITALLSAQKQSAWADVARRIAHEVKNPLTPITLCVERLRSKYEKLNQSTIERYVDTIQKQVVTIQKLIDDFASFARWPAPKKQMTDLLCVIRQSVVALNSVYPGVEMRIHSHLKRVMLWSDPSQMGQLFQNILKNASEAMVEQNSEEKVISVRFDIVDEGGRVVIHFEDTGSGFPDEILQNESRAYITTRARGSGLGLAICRKIAEDHGGELLLKNSGTGALLTLSFPMDG